MQLESTVQAALPAADNAAAFTQPVLDERARRDQFWSDCRNSLGIARLLVHEGRPEPLVSTACRMAVESACRAVLEQAGLPFQGDVRHALELLRVDAPLEPEEGAAVEATVRARLRLAAAERIVAGLAALLRQSEPRRSWGF